MTYHNPDRHWRALLLTLAVYCLTAGPLTAANLPALVDTDWLSQRLTDKQLVIIDMSDSLQYQRFHIPGARHLPYNAINQQSRQGVSYSVGPQAIAKLMGQLGVTPQHTVVIYDDTGGLNAARLYWELQRLHHARVTLLDGGLVKWIREGRSVSWTPQHIQPMSYELKQVNTALLSQKHDIGNTSTLLDVRTQEEYQGHPRVPRSGHIPGARHFPWDSAVNFDSDFTMKSDAELKRMLASLGMTDPNQEVTLYCRSGHRASHTFFTLKRLGWNHVRLYDGSSTEYELDKAAPLKKGPVP
ncbi:MAG: sulfurtransferase [Gammaproteobacteria bacterium]